MFSGLVATGDKLKPRSKGFRSTKVLKSRTLVIELKSRGRAPEINNMTKVLMISSVIFAISSLAKANQRASCWPKHNAISQEVLLSQDHSIEVVVKDPSVPEEESRTVMHIDPHKEGYQMTLKFREGFGEVGTPQNVYAIMVLGDQGQPLLFEDFTGGCLGPGISFFPGQKLDLLKLKSSTLPSSKIHVLLWSR
jgi:hypothetical protein